MEVWIWDDIIKLQGDAVIGNEFFLYIDEIKYVEKIKPNNIKITTIHGDILYVCYEYACTYKDSKDAIENLIKMFK